MPRSPSPRSSVASLVCGLVLLVAFGARADVNVGDPAPDFTLPGTDGKTHSLSDYKGVRPVVIAFFPKAYTGGCTIECKALRDSNREITQFDVAYFMASVDKPEDNKGFAEQNGATFPILSDTDKKVAEAYGVLSSRGYAQRWTFYIDRDGIVQMIDRAVDPKSAGLHLVENLHKLGFKMVSE